MECVLQRSSPHQLLFRQENGDVSSTAGDDSFVDQLLNLNSENTQEDADDDHTQLNDKSSAFLSFPPPLQPPSTAGEGDFGSLLTLPEEEEADLEWLSHFVEDSFAQFNHAAGASMQEIQEPPSRFSPAAVLPRSRRSKRPRPTFPAASWVWTRPSPPPISSSLTESTTSSSPSSSATSSPYWSTSPSTPFAFPNPKKKKGRAGPGGGSRPELASSRRCSHCGTQKTPQWRAGPMGTKTLCNACGVRFKTGRLLPEYRPACSPTFSSELHSNSHRKVLEMRMKKETTGQIEPGFFPAGPNCG